MNRSLPAAVKLFLSGCIFFALLLTTTRAQWFADEKAEKHLRAGIDYVYNLSFDSARIQFQYIVDKYPEHPSGHFFLAMIDWWRIVANIENTSYDDKFLRRLDLVIEICEKRLDQDENDLTALFFKGGALGFQGRLHGNREDWLKAASSGRSAMPIVQKAHKLAPDNYDIFLGTGIYNYYADVIPEHYPFVKPLMIFFPKGDRQKGIQQLREASDKALYADVEAAYFLMQLMQNFEKNSSEALAIASNLHKRYPNNVLFHKYYGRSLASLGHWPEMQRVWTDVLQNVKKKRIGYDALAEREGHYYLGLYEMNSKNYDAALQHLQRSDEISRTIDRKEYSGFRVMTNLKMGLIYDLLKKRELAVAQYNKVLKMNNYQDAHKQAEQYLKTPYAKF